ncbi:hypothetical protein AB0I10_24485 [Streptomyces sp. NPDC050636]|uniref:hypothetical protein n=1 Tax=Streptomyces sp. NPDC050636 TaxID=3154510 RepID=UPI00341A9DC1
MRFATYASADGDRAGVINGDLIHALPRGTNLIELLGPRCGRRASEHSPSPMRSSHSPSAR